MLAATKPASEKGDLSLRVASAIVLIPFGLYVVWAGGLWLAYACALFAAVMAYEWIRVTASPSMKIFVTLALIAPIAAGYFGLFAGLLALAGATFLASLTHPIKARQGAEAFGLLYVSGMPLALYALRAGPWDGLAAALIFMGIVWGSDSAAYFSGRGFGGPPLHPDSPSKTWSGAVGAIIFSVLCGWLAARITGGDLTLWLITGGLISLFAQLGDLFESSIKRNYGVKDASGLVPGHGGVLDRVDGLGLVCIVTVLTFSLVPGLVEALRLAG